jgi:hypothetical protein
MHGTAATTTSTKSVRSRNCSQVRLGVKKEKSFEAVIRAFYPLRATLGNRSRRKSSTAILSLPQLPEPATGRYAGCMNSAKKPSQLRQKIEEAGLGRIADDLVRLSRSCIRIATKRADGQIASVDRPEGIEMKQPQQRTTR